MLYVVYVAVNLIGIAILVFFGGYMGLTKTIKVRTGTTKMDKGDIIPELQDKWDGTIKHYDLMTLIDDIGKLVVVLTVIFVLLIITFVVLNLLDNDGSLYMLDIVVREKIIDVVFWAIIVVAVIINIVDVIVLGDFLKILFGYGTRLLLFAVPTVVASMVVLDKMA